MNTPREAVERTGLDADVLIGQLTRAAQAELALAYRYTILSLPAFALVDKELREVLHDIRTEDRHHLEALLTRIAELGGRIDEDVRDFAAGLPTQEPFTGTEHLIAAEHRAVETYTALCALTAARDQRTHALVEAIRSEELEHEAWLRELHGTGPSGRFHRGFRGHSPTWARSDPWWQ